jgi:hypothetical protein
MLFFTRRKRFRRPGLLLHIGAGDKTLPGWVNIDREEGPGIDMVADVTRGLGFREVRAVYAEHFLEHLPLEQAVRFLADVQRVLAPGGLVRITTPNLEWVWATHYRMDLDEAEKRMKAIGINRAFHGWGHRFLWNRELLGQALAACGFLDISWRRRGESGHDVFRGLESHEKYVDVGDLHHVIIAEASRGSEQPEKMRRFQALIDAEYLDHLEK